MERKVQTDKYQDLIRKAIGSRTQKEFAAIAGLSQYNLNRILNAKSPDAPRKSTLRKIADASEGRVSETQLLVACGYEAPEELFTQAERKPASERNVDIAAILRTKLEAMCGTAVKYATIEGFLDNVILNIGVANMVAKVHDNALYEGTGHRSAERVANCTIAWRQGWYRAGLAFALFACKTEKGGYIISDVVFDLPTLLELHHEKAGAFVLQQAEMGDVNCSDFPVVMWNKRVPIDSPEYRLFKAIFGEDSDELDD